MKFRKENAAERKEAPKRKSGFVSRTVLAAVMASCSVAACTPEVTINNIPYDPARPGCSAFTERCEARTVDLREEGSTAGSNSANVENAVVTLKKVVDQDSTKAAQLELTACEDVAESTFIAGATVRLTVNGESFDVTVNSVSYDSAGVIVNVTVEPVCAGPDGDVDGGSDAGPG